MLVFNECVTFEECKTFWECFAFQTILDYDDIPYRKIRNYQFSSLFNFERPKSITDFGRHLPMKVGFILLIKLKRWKVSQMVYVEIRH